MVQEGQNRENDGGSGVGYDPREIRPDIRKASCVGGLLHSHSVAERQQFGRLFERTAHKLKIKPYARQPRGEVCQQRTAYAADLLYAQHTAAQKSERNEKHRGRNYHEHRPQDVHRHLKAEEKRRYKAHCSLAQSYRQQRQSIAENEICSRERCCIKPLQKRTFAILCDERCRKKRHE